MPVTLKKGFEQDSFLHAFIHVIKLIITTHLLDACYVPDFVLQGKNIIEEINT